MKYYEEMGSEGGDGGGAPAAPATPATPAPAAPWHGVTDPDESAYIQNKGWQTPADVIKSYRNAEKLIGRDPRTLIPMPRADDPAGFRAVMAKLGLPETPDKYEVDIPAGEKPDEGYLNWAKETFHKLGLTAAQVKELTKQHNTYVGGIINKGKTEYEQQVAADKAALLSEWRDGHDRMLNSAKAAANALGFTGPVMDAIEKQIGYAGTMKLFAGLGQKLSEDGFVSSGTKTNSFNGMMTPAEAKAEWENMKIDPVTNKALFDPMHPGHSNAKAKQARLFQIMYPT